MSGTTVVWIKSISDWKSAKEPPPPAADGGLFRPKPPWEPIEWYWPRTSGLMLAGDMLLAIPVPRSVIETGTTWTSVCGLDIW